MTEIVPSGPLSQKQLEAMAREFAVDLKRSGKRGQMIVTETNFARIYIYAGEFVADCPRVGCGNTILMTIKDEKDRGVAWTPYEEIHVFDCGYCGYHTDSVHWPPDAAMLLDVLDCRPIPHTRNWYPEGHVVAVKAGIPDGQTVADLIAENTEHDVPTDERIITMLMLAERGEVPRLGLPHRPRP